MEPRQHAPAEVEAVDEVVLLLPVADLLVVGMAQQVQQQETEQPTSVQAVVVVGMTLAQTVQVVVVTVGQVLLFLLILIRYLL
jgi:hypothetical protein